MPLPVRIPRRSFVGWLGAIAASIGLGARARVHAAPVEIAGTDPTAATAQGASLDAAMLARLAESVLPGELGADGAAKAARDFARFATSYRSNAEQLHPYGSARIGFTGESPVPRWRGQLDALQREARATYARGFAAITAAQRRDLVRAALASERTDRMPDPMAASHVALALVAWYFGTPDATDLCYGARIQKNQCRPLVNSPKEPEPLARRRARSSGADEGDLPATDADGGDAAARRTAGGAA